MMGEIFSQEIVNKGRQVELDVAKGIAILFMIWVHVNEVYQSSTIDGGVHNRIIEFIGSPPAAPIFMLLLGVGIVYSKNSNAKALFRRGVFLIALGFGLNIIRDFIPCYLLSVMNGNDSSYIKEGWELLWGIDILPFAGLSFIFFSVVKKFNINNMNLFVVWCTFATANLFLRQVPAFDNGVLTGIARYFWGIDETSWFPFLTWITFPITGYYFGQILIRCNEKRTLYKKIIVPTAALSVPLWIYSYINDVKFGAFGELWQTDYYHHDILGNIVMVVFALFWISLCFFVCKYIPDIIMKTLLRWSKNINSMYCIHWIIIGFGMLVIETYSLMPLQIFLLLILIIVATDVICIYKNKLEKRIRIKNIDVTTSAIVASED